MILWLSTFAMSAVSALVPFLPMEAFVVAIAATNPGAQASIALGIAAGAGATLGKLVWYELGRRGVDSRWAKKELAKPAVAARYVRWVERTQGRPWLAAAITFLAASVGVPPLLVLSAVCGMLKMPAWRFGSVVLLGRTIRFTALLLGADLALR